jgi:hypothetical protein
MMWGTGGSLAELARWVRQDGTRARLAFSDKNGSLLMHCPSGNDIPTGYRGAYGTRACGIHARTYAVSARPVNPCALGTCVEHRRLRGPQCVGRA